MAIRSRYDSTLTSGTGQICSTDLGGTKPVVSLLHGTYTTTSDTIHNAHFIGFGGHGNKEACIARVSRYGSRQVRSAFGGWACIFMDPVDYSDSSPFRCHWAQTANNDQFNLTYTNRDIGPCNFGHVSFSEVDWDIVTGSVPKSNGDVKYNLSFQPTALIAIFGDSPTNSFPGHGSLSLGSVGAGGLGCGWSDGNSDECWFTTVDGDENKALKQRSQYLINVHDIRQTTTQAGQAIVKALDGDGFTLTWSNTNAIWGYPFAILALGGVNAHVGTFNTAFGIQQITGTQFKPEVLCLGSTKEAASTAVDTGSSGAMFSTRSEPLGVSGSGLTYDDWQLASNTLCQKYSRQFADYAWYMRESTIVRSRGRINSFDNDGFTIQGVFGGWSLDTTYLALRTIVIRAGWTNIGKLRFLERLHDGTALPSNYYLMLCTNAAEPTAETELFNELTQVAGGNGYTSGGIQVDLSTADAAISADGNSGVVDFLGLTITATGVIPASGDPPRYAVLTDDNVTVNSREVLYYWDLKNEHRMRNGDKLNLHVSTEIREG